MVSAKAVLFATLGVLAAIFVGVWAAAVRRARRAPRSDAPLGPADEKGPPTPLQCAVGFVVTFFPFFSTRTSGRSG